MIEDVGAPPLAGGNPLGPRVVGPRVDGGVLDERNRPDLDVWHTADLDEEFTVDSGVETFAEYLELEGRLFAQLDDLVYDRVEPETRKLALRYRRGGLADPSQWPQDWNRSFELKFTDPRAGVLLLHGMSDSPYSLRALGHTLHEHGATVVGMRLPGHGTAPSALRQVQWEDAAAAVRLAAKHLRQAAGPVPLHIIGYSTGAALALHYALVAGDDDPVLPPPAYPTM